MSGHALASAVLGIQSPGLHGLPGNSTSKVALWVLYAVMVAAVGLLFWVGLRRARRQPPMENDEWRARAAMDELCPHGWQAQITIYGSNSPPPPGAPPARSPLVSLDWAELSEEHAGYGEAAIVRRVWARDIAGALQAMVDDRHTDAALEEIERAVRASDEQEWPFL